VLTHLDDADMLSYHDEVMRELDHNPNALIETTTLDFNLDWLELDSPANPDHLPYDPREGF
jgi:hypothetical protein